MTEHDEPAPKLSIYGLTPDAEISESGNLVTLTMIGPNKTKFPIELRQSGLAEFVSRATRALLQSQKILSARGRQIAMQAEAASHVSAQCPVMTEEAVLSVKTSRFLQHYRLTPTQAEALASDLLESARVARANQKKLPN